MIHFVEYLDNSLTRWLMIAEILVCIYVPWREIEFVLLYCFMFLCFKEDPHLATVTLSHIKCLTYLCTPESQPISERLRAS